MLRVFHRFANSRISPAPVSKVLFPIFNNLSFLNLNIERSDNFLNYEDRLLELSSGIQNKQILLNKFDLKKTKLVINSMLVHFLNLD